MLHTSLKAIVVAFSLLNWAASAVWSDTLPASCALFCHAVPLVTCPVGTEGDGVAAWNRARVELPDGAPLSRPTLPKTRLDEMLARGQLTGSEYHLAQMFKDNPCGTKVLGAYYTVVRGIVLDDIPAEGLADPRVGRSKGISEVMRKLRIGLRLMADHYIPDRGPNLEGRGDPEWRTLMAKQLWSANMRRASLIKQSCRSMPKPRRKMMVGGAGANDMATVGISSSQKDGRPLKF
jgi:hypothetical protein